jgi:hypothetical protein
LPASATAGAPDDARTGGLPAAAVAVSVEFGVVAAFGVGCSFAAAAGALRGRLADADLADEACAAVGCEEVNRVKSSRMLRAASQPDKSNSPIATVCLIRLLIVIPAYPKDLPKKP